VLNFSEKCRTENNNPKLFGFIKNYVFFLSSLFKENLILISIGTEMQHGVKECLSKFYPHTIEEP